MEDFRAICHSFPNCSLTGVCTPVRLCLQVWVFVLITGGKCFVLHFSSFLSSAPFSEYSFRRVNFQCFIAEGMRLLVETFSAMSCHLQATQLLCQGPRKSRLGS